MGKSALLEVFVGEVGAQEAAQVRWLRCDEFEQSLDLAACEVLLEDSSLSGVSELEAGRRLLSWLSDLQGSGSVTVLAIDDAQWLDGASARALRFALRRLRVDRVLTVMARRTSTVPAVENWTGDPAATTWLRPRPLSSEQVRELVHRGRSWKLSVDESDRLTHRTAGLPLLVSALVGSARSPRDLDAEGDLPTSVATAVMRLFGAVDEPARRLVEASAVLGEAVPLVVLGQLAPTPDVFEAAEQARVAGLLRVAHDRTFGCTHALLQEAVYDAIPLGRRRDLHARAATCTTGERRLTHRTLAADRPDPDLVVDLVAAADALRGTHGFRRAADLRLKARDVSGDAEQRDELLLEALVDLVSAQDLVGARALAEQAERHPSSPLRDLALGVLARESGEVDTAKVLLQRALDGAVASGTRDIRDRSAMALTYLLALVNAGRPVVDAAEWALHSQDPEVSAEAANLKAMALWWCGDLEEALDGLGTRPARQHTEPVEAELLAGRGLLKMYTGRLHGGTRGPGCHDRAGAGLASFRHGEPVLLPALDHPVPARAVGRGRGRRHRGAHAGRAARHDVEHPAGVRGVHAGAVLARGMGPGRGVPGPGTGGAGHAEHAEHSRHRVRAGGRPGVRARGRRVGAGSARVQGRRLLGAAEQDPHPTVVDAALDARVLRRRGRAAGRAGAPSVRAVARAVAGRSRAESARMDAWPAGRGPRPSPGGAGPLRRGPEGSRHRRCPLRPSAAAAVLRGAGARPRRPGRGRRSTPGGCHASSPGCGPSRASRTAAPRWRRGASARTSRVPASSRRASRTSAPSCWPGGPTARWRPSCSSPPRRSSSTSTTCTRSWASPDGRSCGAGTATWCRVSGGSNRDFPRAEPRVRPQGAHRFLRSGCLVAAPRPPQRPRDPRPRLRHTTPPPRPGQPSGSPIGPVYGEHRMTKNVSVSRGITWLIGIVAGALLPLSGSGLRTTCAGCRPRSGPCARSRATAPTPARPSPRRRA